MSPWRLVAAYGAGAVLAAAIAFTGPWPVVWPALALGLTALAYGTGQSALLGKGVPGWAGQALRLATIPVRTGARINAWAWLRHRRAADEIIPGLWLGAHRAAPDHARVLDLTAELPTLPGSVSLPLLDLMVPGPEHLSEAARIIEAEHRAAHEEGNTLLVACALGLSRSAAAVATWLVVHGQAADAIEARHILQVRRPDVRLRTDHLAAIDQAAGLARQRHGGQNAHPKNLPAYRSKGLTSPLGGARGRGRGHRARACRAL